MNAKSNRNLKVYETSGHNYKPTPTILLKGRWLGQFGFEAGDHIDVRCESGKLIVTKVMDDMTEKVEEN